MQRREEAVVPGEDFQVEEDLAVVASVVLEEEVQAVAVPEAVGNLLMINFYKG